MWPARLHNTKVVSTLVLTVLLPVVLALSQRTQDSNQDTSHLNVIKTYINTGKGTDGNIPPATNDGLRLYSFQADVLVQRKQEVDSGMHSEAVKSLKRTGDYILDMGVMYTVVDKLRLGEEMPPSNNPHDFYSRKMYAWPLNDGSGKWVTIDGKINPTAADLKDFRRFTNMTRDVMTCTLASYFTGDVRYAAHAVSLINTWYIDADTYMTQHELYAQIIPNSSSIYGNGNGIISFRAHSYVVDSLILMEHMGVLPNTTKQGMVQWFNKWLDFLRDSKHSQEGKSWRNHGAWYDAQYLSIAGYLGVSRNDEAHAIMDRMMKRVDVEITAAGTMPAESSRTRGLHYLAFTLMAFARMAHETTLWGIDLLHYTAPNGGSIKAAFDYALPFLIDPSKWSQEQQDPWQPSDVLYDARWMGRVYDDDAVATGRANPNSSYAYALARLPGGIPNPDSPEVLFTPSQRMELIPPKVVPAPFDLEAIPDYWGVPGYWFFNVGYTDSS